MGNHRPAPSSELRLARSQRRPRFCPRRPVKAAGQVRVEKGAVYCPQAGDKLWTGPYRRDGSGRKPSVGDAGDPSMKSTSGTADLSALRGAMGDAAPSALVVGLREQSNHRTVPDVVGVARASERAPKSSGSPVPPVNNGQGAAGGQRKLVVRGLADPRLVNRLRFAGLGFARWDRLVAIQLRLGT